MKLTELEKHAKDFDCLIFDASALQRLYARDQIVTCAYMSSLAEQHGSIYLTTSVFREGTLSPKQKSQSEESHCDLSIEALQQFFLYLQDTGRLLDIASPDILAPSFLGDLDTIAKSKSISGTHREVIHIAAQQVKYKNRVGIVSRNHALLETSRRLGSTYRMPYLFHLSPHIPSEIESHYAHLY
jgi:hypothetical protein